MSCPASCSPSRSSPPPRHHGADVRLRRGRRRGRRQAAALDVGARLAALARHAQVVVVTHLAQVAAYADRHLVVAQVRRRARHPQRGARARRRASGVRELARMLGRGPSTDAALEHARELMGARPGLARRGTMVRMSIRLPARSDRGPRPGLSGPARVDRAHQGPHQAAAPRRHRRHRPPGPRPGERRGAASRAGPPPWSTPRRRSPGATPTSVPRSWSAAGIPLLDDVGPDVMHAVQEGSRLRARRATRSTSATTVVAKGDAADRRDRRGRDGPRRGPGSPSSSRRSPPTRWSTCAASASCCSTASACPTSAPASTAGTR